MDDDGLKGFEQGEAGLQNLIDNWEQIERRALKAVTAVLVPRLREAAPARVSTRQGGNSLPNGALKTACRGVVHVGKSGDDPSTARADFGKYTWIAHIVDRGHDAPYERALKRANATSRAITHRPTPPHPFVRAVQDSTAAAAQTAFSEAMTKGMTEALNHG